MTMGKVQEEKAGKEKKKRVEFEAGTGPKKEGRAVAARLRMGVDRGSLDGIIGEAKSA